MCCRRSLGKVHATRRTPYIAIGFTTLLAFALITFVGEVPALGGTTALLLLCVFTVVNIAVLVLRKDKVEHEHFRTPTFLPVLGALACAFFAGPWTGRDPVQYRIAGMLIGHRRRALVRHRRGQPRAGRAAGRARDGRHRRRRAGELSRAKRRRLARFLDGTERGAVGGELATSSDMRREPVLALTRRDGCRPYSC